MNIFPKRALISEQPDESDTGAGTVSATGIGSAPNIQRRRRPRNRRCQYIGNRCVLVG